jgi:hypothetical protein
VHLLPKLRCQFAEFLNQGSLTRLGILTPPTSVGLRYGRPEDSTRSFSWKLGIDELMRPKARPHPLSALEPRLCLSTPTAPAYWVEPAIRCPAHLAYFVPACFDVIEPVQECSPACHRLRLFGLGLGPD